MALEPGTVVGGYTVIRLLGVGGMGAVYLARHPRLPRDVAVKVLDTALGRDAKARARFEREADIAARLDHANIVRVLDRGSAGDLLWIAMAFIDGPDAERLLSTQQLTAERAVGIIAQAAAGLDHAHELGVVHRDIKPANLLIAAHHDVPGADHVLISDFGIARSLDDTITMTQSVRASFAYAAPELLSGEPVDHRVDIYALGCTLYHLLAGAVPFARATLGATIHAHLAAPPPRLAQVRPGLPPHLDTVIATALAKTPGERYPTCTAFAQAAFHALDPSSRVAPTMVAPAGPVWSGTDPMVSPPGLSQSSPHHGVPSAPGAPSSPASRSDPALLSDPSGRQSDTGDQPRRAVSRRRLLIAAVALPAVAVPAAVGLGAWRNRAAAGSAAAPSSAHLVIAHPAAVHSVAFSPDGTKLATGCGDKSVRLWDFRTRQQVGPVMDHIDQVNAVAFGPDGVLLASASADRNVQLWEVATGRRRGTPMLHPAVVDTVAFSPDGRTLASSGIGSRVRLWSVERTEQVTTNFAFDQHSYVALAFSPDGTRLAGGSIDRLASAWDPRTADEIGFGMSHSKPVTAVAFSPDSKLLATASDDGGVRLWETRQHDLWFGTDIFAHPQEVRSLAYHPDGTMIAAGMAGDFGIRLWDTRTRQQIGEPLLGHTAPITALAFSPDGRTLASSGEDDAVRLWEVPTH
ncbi:WD40 repeat domain-containing serine/threonine protein kinase [Nocardia sp. NPDC127579]|uniref:WD40 repeat domain-containing serine/threonine protein kinase n=1 Tax=Nocardia sp. NPDC127579 TaxID=3345402 RepID=UPI0036415132